LIYVAALLVLYILALIIESLLGIPDLATLFFFLSFVAVVVSATAVGAKRLHDRNKSGWWLLLLYGLPGGLAGVDRPMGYEIAFDLVGTIISIWALIELGFLRGTRGRNQFGSDPLAVGDIRARR
jgi:uncharacterized membrane protein YhaH (DUF805 family)